jgi:hypothetical protein
MYIGSVLSHVAIYDLFYSGATETGMLNECLLKQRPTDYE